MTEQFSPLAVAVVMESVEKEKGLTGMAKKQRVLNTFKPEDRELVNDTIELLIRLSKDRSFLRINRSLYKRILGCCT